MPDYVPNMLRCAKCNFELERFTLNANTGAVGIGTNEPEHCPNGCGPLWRVTWEQEAQYLGKRMNEWADRAIAAEKRLADALGVLRMVNDNHRVDAGERRKAWHGPFVVREVRRVLEAPADGVPAVDVRPCSECVPLLNGPGFRCTNKCAAAGVARLDGGQQ